MTATMIPTRHNETKTGRTRFRSQAWTHLLVVQVEVKRLEGPPDSNGMPVWLPGVLWRDATVKDLPLTQQPEEET